MKRLTAAFLFFLARVAPARSQGPRILIKDGETIAFLGDSITAGGASYGGYCRLVIQGLKSVGVKAKPVFAGVHGNTSADMLLRLDQAVGAARRLSWR